MGSHHLSAQTGIFVRKGEYWSIGLGGEVFSLRDINGLSYIQFLLQHPGEEFHAIAILNAPAGQLISEGSSSEEASVPSSPALSIGGLGDAGELLDTQAKQEYKRRLADLKEQIEDLHERGDHEGAVAAELESESLTRELVRAVGLGGRDRRAGSADERARVNVTRAIKTALQRLSALDNSLGELLGRSIRTGLFCRYVADAEAPIAWQLSLEKVTDAVESNA